MTKKLPKRYKFQEIEKKFIQKWKDEGTYNFTLNEEDKHEDIFSIDTPPPFTSGDLHMGHILNHAWIDFMARFRRRQGKNVYFPQGFDCHGLPTELKVQAKLEEDGKDTKDRELFVKTCYEWTEQYISNMMKQFDQLGYSTDWNYSYRTMEDTYIRLVQLSLLEFYKKGWLYRAKHPVHWCTKCETSLAKQEVGYKEMEGKIWEIKLPLHGREGEHVTIATTRPEMMEACIAVFVHPSDYRYMDLSAAKVDIPFTDRVVPIFMDHVVDPNFGTGVVYCCTYGDETDLMWKLKYDLPEYQVIGPDGLMTEESKFEGMSVEDAQDKIVQELEDMGLIVSEKPFPHRVIVHSERSSCQTPIEYLSVPQWFIKVKDFTEEIKKDGLSLDWRPDLSNILEDWCDSLTWDWVISRQRMWGTPIPFWYCSNMECDYVISPKMEALPLDPMQLEPPEAKCPECGHDIIGEKDVCDCWVDSSITPLRISQWKMDEQFFDKVYPTTNRPQGYEIIRTWLFYTLFRSKKLTGERPFSEVMMNGMVAGPDGKKMSKSFGNTVAPDEIIPYYGTDAIRQWAAMATLGTDYPFKYNWVMAKNPKQRVKKDKVRAGLNRVKSGKWTQEQFDKKYRKSSDQMVSNSKFLTKMWNAYRLIHMNCDKVDLEDIEIDNVEKTAIDEYILNQVNENVKDIHDSWDGYHWRDGYTVFRSFFWGTICDSYLEALKYRMFSDDEKTKLHAVKISTNVFFQLLKVISVISPFITEELFQEIFSEWSGEDSIHHCLWPEKYTDLDDEKIKLGEYQILAAALLRNGKSQAKISLGKEIDSAKLFVPSEVKAVLDGNEMPVEQTLRVKKLDVLELEELDNMNLSKAELVEDEETKWQVAIYKTD